MAYSRPPLPPPQPDQGTEPAGVNEALWLDVIQQMDEVYSRLVADDIALEQKNAELEQRNSFISSLLESMSDLVVACRDDGEIRKLNPALAQLVGREADSLLGTPIAELAFREADRRALQALCRQTPAEGATVEICLRDAQAQAAPVEFHARPRQDSSGAIDGVVLVGRPVGELRRAYQQLQDAHSALQNAQQQLLHAEKMASLGRLVAGVAHELNNPISFVLGNVHALSRYAERIGRYLEVVHRQPQPPEVIAARTRLKLDRIAQDLPSLIQGTVEGAQRTAEIVNGLKRFSAMDDEPVQALKLLEVIERAVLWVRKGVHRRLETALHVDAELEVLAAPGLLLQVLMNLIQNACDAAIGAGRDPVILAIRAQLDGATLQLAVTDNGPGVDPALASRIFEPFVTTKPPGQGTGLGLSISYGIIERHGGTLALDADCAEPGLGGACFVIRLPRPTG